MVCPQIELPRLELKTEGAGRNRDVIGTGVGLINLLPSISANYWLNAIILDSEADRAGLLEYANSRDGGWRRGW